MPVASSDAGQHVARVLVADDNADMRAYVGRLLSDEYAVEAVADGAAALDAVRRQAPDLVLSDVMMPRLDGFGLLRELRADPATAGVPVVLLSARAGEESRVEGMQAGADDYLVKPFSARELRVRVAALLQVTRLRRESEQRFRQLADAMPQIVWTAGPDGGIDYLNRRWAEFTGLPETVSNEGWGPLLHPDEAAAARERWAASVRTGEPFEMELRLLDRARGAHRWHLIRTVAVRDATGA